jgi:hypothetical protein
VRISPPRGANVAAVSGFRWPLRYVTRRPVAVCQSAAFFGPAVTIQRPSALKRASLTGALWPPRTRTVLPLAALQRRASLSRLEVRTSEPPGLNEAEVSARR